MDKNYSTRREILYGYDDAGNLTSEQRRGVDFDRRDESVRYYYDKANQLTKTTVEGVTVKYQYDLAGNLLNDGKYTYTYDLQNRLLTKAGTNGTTTYTYDAAGNLLKKTAPDGLSTYEYTAQNKLKKGTNPRGEMLEYSYNALGVRVQNIQIRGNANMGYMNALLDNGSRFMKDYMAALSDERNTWQPTWETEVGTTVQNATEKVTKNYVVDYLSVANRDIMVYEEGSFTQRNVYDHNSKRISVELAYAAETQRGESGENIASDTAVRLQKVWYRTSHLDSTLFAVNASGAVVYHAIYDAWGNPITDTSTDLNFTGLDNRNNYTGYTWDETLELYFAQARFYDAENHRFTQEDPFAGYLDVPMSLVKYLYVQNNPLRWIDPLGLMYDRGGGPMGPAIIASKGNRNNNPVTVEKLQNQLYILGLYTDDVDGLFGSNTEKAVRDFQLLYDDLMATGYADTNTVDKLNDIFATFGDIDLTARTNAKYTIRQLQTNLKMLGLYHDSIDGSYGPNTRSAIKRFQMIFNDLDATGEADAKTMRRLSAVMDRYNALPPVEALPPVTNKTAPTSFASEYSEKLSCEEKTANEKQIKINPTHTPTMGWKALAYMVWWGIGIGVDAIAIYAIVSVGTAAAVPTGGASAVVAAMAVLYGVSDIGINFTLIGIGLAEYISYGGFCVFSFELGIEGNPGFPLEPMTIVERLH